jgi:hypothetical protein
MFFFVEMLIEPNVWKNTSLILNYNRITVYFVLFVVEFTNFFIHRTKFK